MKQFIFGFVVGGAVVGGITYFVTKSRIEQSCKSEIAEMRERYFENASAKKAAVIKEMEKPEPEVIVNGYATDEKEVYDRAELEGPEDDAPEEYYEDEPERIEAMNDDLENIEYDRNNHNKDPEIIVEPVVGTHGFETSYLTYYMEDKVLIDSQEQIVDDPRSLLGTCLEDSGFLENSDTSNELFVRNYRLGTDYCVAKDTGKWDS